MYRRLFKGASSGNADAPRSPEDARAVSDLSEELRGLKAEIKKLREALDTGNEPQKRGSGRRGGRRSGRDREDDRAKGGSFSQRGRRDGAPKTPPDDAPVGLLVDYLKKHQVLVFEGQDDYGQNEAFEHLSRHIGQHFELLAHFYEKMKRAVATGKTSRIDIDNYSEQERSAAVQLGTLLYRHGMLKDFYYHRSPKRQLRVIPNKDGEIQQFLTGGWLEIYVVWLLSRRLRACMSSSKYQVLYNVKGTLPDGREFESDLMACIDGQLLWLECKTGQWQDYSARFRGLVKTFGTDRKGAGLVLIKPPDGSTRGRATDMLDMTLLSLAEVGDFVDDFLGVPVEERQPDEPRSPRSRRGGSGRRRSEAADRDDRTAPLPAGVIPPKSEDEIPLENAEPARKLGRVDLSDGKKATASEGEEEVPRRRRRRRRGGRGRGGSGGGGESASTESSAKALKEELPVTPFEESEEGERPEEATASTERELEATTETAAVENAESDEAGEGDEASRKRRRRGSRGGRRRRGRGGSSAEGEEASSEAEESEDSIEDEVPRGPIELRPVQEAPADEDAVAEAEESEESAEQELAAEVADEPELEEPVVEPSKSKAAPLIPEGMVIKRPESAGEVPKAEVSAKKAKPETVRVPRSTSKKSVIAPDLSAMLAGGGSKDENADEEK